MRGRSSISRPGRTVALALASAWVLATTSCREAVVADGAHQTSQPTAASTSKPALVTLLAPLPGAIVVVPPALELLPYTLVPIEGSDAVLAVSQAPGGGPTFAQRFDGATHTLDPAFEVNGAFIGSAFATSDDEMKLLEISGMSMVLESRSRGGARAARQPEVWVHADWGAARSLSGSLAADLVVKVGPRLLALALGAPPDDDAQTGRITRSRPAGSTKADAGTKPARPKPPPPKKASPKPPKGRKPPARKPHDEAKSPARRKLALWGAWLDRPLSDDGDNPFDTGVRLEEPMAGLGLVGAGTRAMRDGTPRVDVVFYEWVSEQGTQADKAVGRARFATVGLDFDGASVDGTRAAFDEGDLFFGFLAPSIDPRLSTAAGGSVLLSQTAQRGACQATLVTPARAPIGVAKLPCAFDPARIVDAAEERRKPTRDPSIATRAEAFDAMASALLAQGAHRAEWQPAWDGPLAALGPSHGFVQTATGDLRSFDRHTFELRDEPRPLVAHRARGYAASIAADGEALVRTHAGLRLVHVDGTIDALPDPLSPGPGREDERFFTPSPFARIGRSWWTARGAPRRLFPAATSTRSPGTIAHPQAAVLVGGAERGVLLELDGDAMTVSSLDEAGGLRVLSRVRAPIVPPFDAVARTGGGALVVGPRRDRAGRLAALVVMPDGTVHGGRAELDAAVHGPVPRLVALPGRGAIVLPREGAGAAYLPDQPSAAAWLDDRGDAIASLPMRFPRDACLDGVPMQGGVPDVVAGVARRVPALDDPSVCVVGLPAVDASGVMRFVVSHRAGAEASLELLRVDSSPVDAPRSGDLPPALPPLTGETKPRCPAEMVLVDRRFCVDRWESTIAEGATGRLASPDYPITPNLFAAVLGDWAVRRERVGHAYARAFPLPRPEPFQMNGVDTPTAVSRAGVFPSGYLTGLVAKDACGAAGKRLCKKEEFRTACRGEKNTRFPYGDEYVERACNVAHAMHPAAILHGHASIGHLDPRLGRVPLDDAAPGLRSTGSTPTCASRWGGDAIYDMNGNLDEWIDEKGGAFAGGFYARGTKNGCDAIVDSHPPSYLDYSTGVRCCKDAS